MKGLKGARSKRDDRALKGARDTFGLTKQSSLRVPVRRGVVTQHQLDDWKLHRSESTIARFENILSESPVALPGSPMQAPADTVGCCTYNDGSMYDGGWLRGKRHGQGSAVEGTASGWKYSGEWLEDKPHGLGRGEHKSGGIYQGEWRDGKRHGHGVWCAPDGENYCGDWIAGVRHGHGKWSFHSFAYTGDWVDGEFHGTGLQTWSSEGGTYHGSYEGCFKKGQWDGEGVERNNSTVYKGEFWKGEKRGFGTFYCGGSIVFEGQFEGNQPTDVKGFTDPDSGIEIARKQKAKWMEARQVESARPSHHVHLGGITMKQLNPDGNSTQQERESTIAACCSWLSDKISKYTGKSQLKATATEALWLMCGRKVTRAYDQWKRRIAENRDQEHVLDLAVRKFLQMNIRCAWTQWRMTKKVDLTKQPSGPANNVGQLSQIADTQKPAVTPKAADSVPPPSLSNVSPTHPASTAPVTCAHHQPPPSLSDVSPTEPVPAGGRRKSLVLWGQTQDGSWGYVPRDAQGAEQLKPSEKTVEEHKDSNGTDRHPVSQHPALPVKRSLSPIQCSTAQMSAQQEKHRVNTKASAAEAQEGEGLAGAHANAVGIATATMSALEVSEQTGKQRVNAEPSARPATAEEKALHEATEREVMRAARRAARISN